MKITRFMLYCLVSFSLLMPHIAIVKAENKPKYVGINEDQELIYNTIFDKNPLENYFEDNYPEASESWVENETDYLFDQWDYDEDTIARKYIINDIGDEDEKDSEGLIEDWDDVKYVKIKYEKWKSEDKSEWDDIDKSVKGNLYEPDEKVYADIVISQTIFFFKFDALMCPKGLNWEKVADEANEWYEDNNLDENFGVDAIKVNYFFQDKYVGIKTILEFDNDDVDDFESISKFTDDGVSYYHEWTYGGDIIVKLELDSFGGVYLIENWWWITLTTMSIACLIIVVLVLVIKKR